MTEGSSLDRIREAWQRRAAGALGHAAVALGLLVSIGALHLAREGTPLTRAVAAAAMVVSAVVYVVSRAREARALRSPRRTIRKVLAATDKPLSERALRALSLVQRTETDERSGAPELARLHFDRLMARAPVQAVEAAASRHAQRWRGAALALLLCAAFVVLLSPVRVLEGGNVLAARGGIAPFPMDLLRYPRISAQPPAYTRQPERSLVLGGAAALPKGTVLTVRGVPHDEGRRLIVTDGNDEVPFVSDGAGGVVARFTVKQPGEVRVAARFGEVTVQEHDAITVDAVADALPAVALKGAPKTVKLTEVENIEIEWTAMDDHGLRQVDLVLRSGSREDRRVLGRFDGESKQERGGHVLVSRDAFLRRMFLPVTVRVEAKDDDPVDGPKWGRSEAIIVLPPTVGEPEARRYLALLRVRDAVTDLLAWHLATEREKTEAFAAHAAEQKQRVQAVVDEAQSVLEASYGGLTVPRGVRAFAQGQLRKLSETKRSSAQFVDTTENVLLALDMGLRQLGSRDAEAVAKRLGDIAEEVATGARLAREPERGGEAALKRLDEALTAVDAGAAQLVLLGPLGQDVGSVAKSELVRIHRARKSSDFMHTELAALHLAARLRRPVPSFGSAGGGGRGGVESGASPQSGGSESGAPPSDAPRDFDQLAEELGQLAREHSDSVDSVQKALDEAATGEDTESLREEAKQRARKIRDAIESLPPPGEEPGSRRASEALAREHAGSMAHALEKLDLSGAVESGRSAAESMRDAQRRPGFGSVDDAEAAEIRRELEEQLEWARNTSEKLRQNAEARARAALDHAAEREQGFADRAQKLSEKGNASEASLPEQMAERLEQAQSIMQEATRALRQGQGERGLELQREAQRLLEQSNAGRTTDDDPEPEHQPDRPREGSAKGTDIATEGEVPDADKRRRAEEFRERVLRGLAKDKSDRLSPAIKRYAEGLLQ